MRSQFMISKNFFIFLITINMEKVTVETGEPCNFKKDFCDVFAKCHESLVEDYLRRQENTHNIYSHLLNYHSEEKWSITEMQNSIMH